MSKETVYIYEQDGKHYGILYGPRQCTMKGPLRGTIESAKEGFREWVRSLGIPRSKWEFFKNRRLYD